MTDSLKGSLPGETIYKQNTLVPLGVQRVRKETKEGPEAQKGRLWVRQDSIKDAYSASEVC